MNKVFIKQMLSTWNQNGNTSFIGAGVLGSVCVGLVIKLLLT